MSSSCYCTYSIYQMYMYVEIKNAKCFLSFLSSRMSCRKQAAFAETSQAVRCNHHSSSSGKYSSSSQMSDALCAIASGHERIVLFAHDEPALLFLGVSLMAIIVRAAVLSSGGGFAESAIILLLSVPVIQLLYTSHTVVLIVYTFERRNKE